MDDQTLDLLRSIRTFLAIIAVIQTVFLFLLLKRWESYEDEN